MLGKKPGTAAKRKGPANISKPDIQMYVDPFITANVNNHQQPPPSPHRTQYLLDGESTSLPESSYFCHSTPVSASQVANVSSSQIANLSSSITTFISGAPQIVNVPHTFASFTPMSTINFSQGTPTNTSVRASQVGADTISAPPAVISNHPFQLKFLTASIKVCARCRGGYDRGRDGKSAPPPNDLCLVRKEQHLYYNVVNGRQQYSSLANVHYHANTTCPQLRCPNFIPSMVEIPDAMRDNLLPEHWLFLIQAFGIVALT